MKKIITYTLLLLLPFVACKKKYPEDPRRTTKSPGKRLRGWWNISEYTLNGVSIKDTLSKIATVDISSYAIGFIPTDDYPRELTIQDTQGNNFDGEGSYGSTAAINDMNYIALHSHSQTFDKIFVTPFKYVSGSSVKWTITKLYDKDLSLKLVTDTGEYKIMFNKAK